MPKSNTHQHATHQDVKNDLLAALHALDPGAPEYPDLLTKYKTLCEIEAIGKPESAGIKPWIPAIGNAVGIGIMGVFELYGAIFTSKAASLFGGKLLK